MPGRLPARNWRCGWCDQTALASDWCEHRYVREEAMSRVLHVITVLSLILTSVLGSGVPPRAALSATPVQCSGDTSPPFYQPVQPGQAATIAYDGATIVLDGNAVSAATNTGIAPINQSDM